MEKTVFIVSQPSLKVFKQGKAMFLKVKESLIKLVYTKTRSINDFDFKTLKLKGNFNLLVIHKILSFLLIIDPTILIKAIFE